MLLYHLMDKMANEDNKNGLLAKKFSVIDVTEPAKCGAPGEKCSTSKQHYQ